jgi:hypothetical protein
MTRTARSFPTPTNTRPISRAGLVCGTPMRISAPTGASRLMSVLVSASPRCSWLASRTSTSRTAALPTAPTTRRRISLGLWRFRLRRERVRHARPVVSLHRSRRSEERHRDGIRRHQLLRRRGSRPRRMTSCWACAGSWVTHRSFPPRCRSRSNSPFSSRLTAVFFCLSVRLCSFDRKASLTGRMAAR